MHLLRAILGPTLPFSRSIKFGRFLRVICRLLAVSGRADLNHCFSLRQWLSSVATPHASTLVRESYRGNTKFAASENSWRHPRKCGEDSAMKKKKQPIKRKLTIALMSSALMGLSGTPAST